VDIEIRALTETDIPQAMELKNFLGWNQTPEDWRRFFSLSPEGSFKALRGQELVGTAIAQTFDKVCWIGMVIVKEGCRHQGVGREMMKRCLEYSAKTGCNLNVLDATRDGVSLYARLGFQPEFLVGAARGKVSRKAGQTDAHPDFNIRRIEVKDLDRIVSLEACALGAVREALLHQLVKQNPGRGFVCHNSEGNPEGFVLHRPGFHSHQVGPLIARNDEAAELLVQEAFADLEPTRGEAAVILTVPMNQAGMQKILRARGLRVEPRLTRMFRGRKRLQAREDMVYALSGPEKG